MIVLLAAGFMCIVVLWQLLVHPVQSVLAISRLLCGAFGILLLLTALGRFWNDAYLEAAGLLGGAVFLFWCTNRLSHQGA
ncbi:hypothetical protein ACFY5D_21265 [Paeniglutamicibacter sp. NPDC012692]|uniref:hypothetical protein n=1 Tax=Paeniglutamicibacter sp. NPDC012692 TaxID=3364388 RepID=UPI0036D1CD14